MQMSSRFLIPEFDVNTVKNLTENSTSTISNEKT